MNNMKCVISLWLTILLLSHISYTTIAYESNSRFSFGIHSSTLEQRTQTSDCKQPCSVNSRTREMVVQIKKVRTIPGAGVGGVRPRARSSAIREKASPLQLHLVIYFSIFFAYFIF